MLPDETLDIHYYINILKNRKRYFIIPALVIALVALLISRLLPAIYESSSTILIEEQQIPPDFVRSTVTGFADQRIQSLTQQILSRVKLREIIKQFNLYPELRKTKTHGEIIGIMRDNIKLNTISAEVAGRHGHGQTGVTIAFSIAYRGKDPGMVQKVAGTLASLYLEQNLKTREAQAQSTTKFLEAELKELQERIKGLGDKITTFKEKNDGLLPEQQSFNRSQAESLDSQIKQIDTNLRNAEERKIYLQGQIATVNPEASTLEPRGSPSARLKALELKLVDLRAKFSDDYPDVRKTRREIAELKKMVGQTGGSESMRRQKLAQLKTELAEKQGKYSDHYPEVKRLKNEIAHLEQEPAPGGSPAKPGSQGGNPAYINLATQIKAAETDIASLRTQQAALQKKLQMYRQRIENAPKVEQTYLALMRDYQNASQKYQDIMNKILEARIAEGLEEHQKGEKFTLIDPASRPQKPVSPNRGLILLSGIFLGMVVGLGTVALAEHLDHSVKSSDELARLTGLPILGSIIRIKTNEDINQARRKQRMVWALTGFTLLMGLALFHFFYMDLRVLTAKLLRLADKYS
jgi:succinoglycan biosynthesis transport protein ExoP